MNKHSHTTITGPLLDTLHGFNKVQIIQNISKPSEVMQFPLITTSAVKNQGPTLEAGNVYTLTDKVTNYGQKL